MNPFDTINAFINALAWPPEVGYIGLVLALFFFPQFLQRWRIPAAIGALGLGALIGIGLGRFQQDSTIQLLATFGIVSLFLLAGLEVDFTELRKHIWLLLRHLVIRIVVLAIGAFALGWCFDLAARPALIFSLALFTPSVGFILSSLARFGLVGEEALQVKIQAISSEILALGILFVCIQSVSFGQLAATSGTLLGVIALLPLLFVFFARHLLPHAPKSEFAFLLIIAIASAWTTKLLGAYYLLGAFLAGLVAVRTRHFLPAVVSPKLLHALELFAAFFIPFYFFNAGLVLRAEDFSLRAILIGFLLVVILLPIRVIQVMDLRRLRNWRGNKSTVRIAVAMLPTLVFTLVIARILRDQYGLPADLYGALIIYTLVNTLVPGFMLRSTPDYSAPTVNTKIISDSQP